MFCVALLLSLIADAQWLHLSLEADKLKPPNNTFQISQCEYIVLCFFVQQCWPFFDWLTLDVISLLVTTVSERRTMRKKYVLAWKLDLQKEQGYK